MTLKSYIWGMRFITLFSFFSLGAVIFYVDPENSGMIGIFLFYLAVFFVLSGIFNLILLFIRRIFLGHEMAVENIELSFRQGILLAIIAIGILILQSYQMLVWWDALLVVAGVFLIELYFLSRD
ncbi:MAG: hypothetical protein COX29_02065 [Candidatus Moranbacteria bacterium CG23_combo_of_CG06-09_8_20_14_all_35_22]|nr:MAG: hypothetical protein COX29_02065 [Candidatus Moranbacteria bacterium CG23_combo_of_CG06-09_8_20_14_all_35_22]